MANLFNYTSQRLSAEELRQMNSFNSYNYAGVVAKENPFTIEDNTMKADASEENPIVFLGGGLLITYTTPISVSLRIRERFAYLKVVLDEETGTITNDEYSKITLEYTSCSYLKAGNQYTIFTVVDVLEGDPSSNHLYEYADGTYTETTDEEIEEGKTYYAKYESQNFSFGKSADLGATKIFNYNGNTIWLDNNTFIIPLGVRTADNELYQVVCVRDLKDLSGFLSLEAYAKLKAYCDGTFVWTEGGEDEVTAPDGTTHMKGDVGELNITGNVIRNRINEENPVEIERLAVGNFKEATSRDRIVADENGKLSLQKNYKVPVADGGTYIENSWDESKPRCSAKRNLGIWYGTQDPSNVYPFNPAVEGDIYLKIIE